MPWTDKNQLIVQHEDVYYNRHEGISDQFYNTPGNYQFQTIKTIIDQFLIGYVGTDKLISKVNRLDVQYHAMRGLAEFSFDFFM